MLSISPIGNGEHSSVAAHAPLCVVVVEVLESAVVVIVVVAVVAVVVEVAAAAVVVGTILPISLSPNQSALTLHHNTCVAFKYSFVLRF